MGAKLFIYISKYEGFGLPVLEAMTLGVPTITSNISSMPEIAGKAALKINPDDVTAVKSSIEKLLGDDLLYKKLKEAGIKQASSFNWKKTATETLNVYNDYEGK